MEKNKNSFLLFTLAGFVLCSGISLQAMEHEKKETECGEKSKIALAVINPLYDEATYQAFQKIVALAQATHKKSLAQYLICDKEFEVSINHRSNHTQQGIVMVVGGWNTPKELYMPWGTVDLIHSNVCPGPGETDKHLSKLWEKDFFSHFKLKRYQSDPIEMSCSSVSDVLEVDGHALPSAGAKLSSKTHHNPFLNRKETYFTGLEPIARKAEDAAKTWKELEKSSQKNYKIKKR